MYKWLYPFTLYQYASSPNLAPNVAVNDGAADGGKEKVAGQGKVIALCSD
jgi:hypothetical protein